MEDFENWWIRDDIEGWYEKHGVYKAWKRKYPKRTRAYGMPPNHWPRHLFVVVHHCGASKKKPVPGKEVNRWEHRGGPTPPKGRFGYIADRAHDAYTNRSKIKVRDAWRNRSVWRRFYPCGPNGEDPPECACLRPKEVVKYRFRNQYPVPPEGFNSPHGAVKWLGKHKDNAMGSAINSNTFVASLIKKCKLMNSDGSPIKMLPNDILPGVNLADFFKYDEWPGATPAELTDLYRRLSKTIRAGSVAGTIPFPL